jgi:hypothetical protein
MVKQGRARIAMKLPGNRVREATRLGPREQTELMFDLVLQGRLEPRGPQLFVETAPGPVCSAPGLRRPQIVLVGLPGVFRSWLTTGIGTVTLEYLEGDTGQLEASLTCRKCRATWSHAVLANKQLPGGYWKCPNGCNADE